MLNKVIEQELFKATIADIDIKALAKKFKPLIEKQLEKEIVEYLSGGGFSDVIYDEIGDMVDELTTKVIIPDLKQKMGIVAPKKATKR